ncbi:MAG: Lrp/AsnC family transcriptional regulator [Melioribacteraceae bacterium]|nr:Lrp/AsnC family transcriptional regulator [Melioribacteraceae bacterium]MCF8264750.1 Lrp/AsnC family transcriptional regulator [Melioribacteraceae bacterium]MCF8431680.1 Lrp/AsnC family transcriptional regulator [Melioribacteraceae bacterium]
MLDKIDLKVLDMLQSNSRTKRSTLAEAVGLSIPSLSERLKKLEDHGVVEGYYTRLNPKIFGFDIIAIIHVITESSKYYEKLIQNVNATPEIIECYSILGDGSHIMKAVVKRTSDLESLLGLIQSWAGVNRTVTSLVLSKIKETTALNIYNETDEEFEKKKK